MSNSKPQLYFLLIEINRTSDLKAKNHANLLSFENLKMFVCQQKQQNNCQVCY